VIVHTAPMRIAVAALLVFTAACGDDADTSCGTEGTATGSTAEVAGAPLGPFNRAIVKLTEPTPGGAQIALILDESPGGCDDESTGRRVVIAWCDTPAPGEYEVVPALTLRCPPAGPSVSALIEEADGTDVATTIGTLDVSHAGGCVKAHYELTVTIGAAMLVGDADAVVCD
jgi:hypothetical protein